MMKNLVVVVFPFLKSVQFQQFSRKRSANFLIDILAFNTIGHDRYKPVIHFI